MLIQVKTMRDVWDRSKKKKDYNPTRHILLFALRTGPYEKYKIFPLEVRKYYVEYLARKKAFSETKDEMVKAFAEYEKKLGGAGFSKI